MVRMSACSPVLLPFGSTGRWRTAAFVGCSYSRSRGSKGRVRCYREEGGGSGGASSAPDGQQQPSG